MDQPQTPPALFLRAGLWTAVIAVPLAWSPSLWAGYTLPKLLLTACAVLLCGIGLLQRPQAGRPQGLGLALSLCAVALAVSTLASQDYFTSLIGRYNSYELGLCALLLYAAVYASAASLAPGSKELPSVIVAICGVLGAHAVLQRLGIDPFPPMAQLQQHRSVSTLGSPIDLGAYLAMTLPLALHWAMRENPGLGWPSAALIAGGLAATGTRGAWLGAAFGCAGYLALTLRAAPASLRKANPLWLVLAGFLACAAIAPIAARDWKMGDSARVEIWRTAWLAFQERPLLGHGPDSFEIAFRRLRTEAYCQKMGRTDAFQGHAHNDMLQALATTGLFGAAAYLFLLASLLWAWRKTFEEPGRGELAAGLGAGLLSLFISMKFNPVSLEVLILAAVFVGLLTSSPRAGPPSRALGLCCLLLGTATTGAVFQLTRADRSFKAGHDVIRDNGHGNIAFLRFTEASRLNPYESFYRIPLVNLLGDMINAVPDKTAKAKLLGAAIDSGQQAVTRRPQDANSHYILGMGLLMAAQLGLNQKLAPAAASLDAALRLEPNFIPLLQMRREVAVRAGDTAKISALSADIKRIEILTPGSPLNHLE